MEREQLRALVEAILLTARGPVTSDAVVEALAEERVTAEDFNSVVEAIASWGGPTTASASSARPAAGAA
jgi:hypothetical protein